MLDPLFFLFSLQTKETMVFVVVAVCLPESTYLLALVNKGNLAVLAFAGLFFFCLFVFLWRSNAWLV